MCGCDTHTHTWGGHIRECKPFLVHFIETTHVGHPCDGLQLCEASPACRWVDTVVGALETDAATFRRPLSRWLWSLIKTESDVPAHATLHQLIMRCAHHTLLDTVVMKAWMDVFNPYRASVLHLRQMLALRGSHHPLLRRAVVQTMMHCLRTEDEGCERLATLVPFTEAMLTCDEPHCRQLQCIIEHWLLEETVSVTPHVLRCVAVLWEHNVFDIRGRGCFDRLVPCLRDNVDILEHLIGITWQRDPVLLPRLLEVRRAAPFPASTHILVWDAALSAALTVADMVDHHPDRVIHHCNHCSLVYAYATVAPNEEALLRYARHSMWTGSTLEVAMPPRLAILYPLDGVTVHMIQYRLTMAYKPHIEEAHRVVAHSAHVAWWISWMGYFILFLRLTTPDAPDAATVIGNLSTSTVVSLLGGSLRPKEPPTRVLCSSWTMNNTWIANGGCVWCSHSSSTFRCIRSR